MGCQHLEEIYELFLLGALSDQGAQELREHLARGCPHCRERIREAAETVYLLSLTSKPARPNPQVKTELLHGLHKK
jgi:predicted anti-sigma-YlaC factor YlaD